MNAFGKIQAKLGRIVYKKLKTSKEISRLRGESTEASELITEALCAAFKNKASMEEKVYINKIESLRTDLNSSSTEVSITDYGSRMPGLTLTAAEMCQGGIKTTTIGKTCRRASQPRRWGFLLFRLVRELKPTVCLELGTALGISTAYQAAALELNHHGRIVTLEGAESLALLARENFDRLGLERVAVRIGRFQDTLGEVLSECAPIDFVFIDGHHDEHATLAYFEQIFPFLSERAVLVFDDIAWSKGMERAWKTIVADKRIQICIDLFKLGICAVGSFAEEKKSFFKIALD
jgi:predicted O-methyltransferase YrrM